MKINGLTVYTDPSGTLWDSAGNIVDASGNILMSYAQCVAGGVAIPYAGIGMINPATSATSTIFGLSLTTLALLAGGAFLLFEASKKKR
jgi:hypothetical protein